jgi:hypothetical protein
MNLRKSRFPLILFFVIIIFATGSLAGFIFSQSKQKTITAQPVEDKYELFLSETYNLIKDNYWEKLDDSKLVSIYELALTKLTGSPIIIKDKNKAGLIKGFTEAAKTLTEDKKKELATTLTDLVISNLNPAGRSRLYTQKQEKDLSNLVQNINPEKNLYSDLGVDKNASVENINQTFQKQADELSKIAESSPSAKAKLKEIEYAKDILTDNAKKQRYDQTQAEPTSLDRIIDDQIAYIRLVRFSPDTLSEFQQSAAKLDKGNVDALILDLRGNIGGAIDILPYILGPFIGPNQYAYELFHQGEHEPVKTVTGWLPSLTRYKKVVVLVDKDSQSSAELMAATLKKYHVGVLLGEKTKGWGTIERVFPVSHQLDDSEKYSLMLVHRLTLRDDGQPIEGNGVEPDILLSDKNWRQSLLSYFNYPALISALEKVIK